MSTATATLASTTFLTKVGLDDTVVYPVSLSGITPGICLYVDLELMVVERLTGIASGVLVRRGIEGTQTRRHAINVAVYIGRGDQFYVTDPSGVPSAESVVSPHINILTGAVWVMTGDDVGPGRDARIWQRVTTAPVAGALGVRNIVTTTPT